MSRSSTQNLASQVSTLRLVEASLKALELVLPRIYGNVMDTGKPIPAILCANRNYLRQAYQSGGPVTDRKLPIFAYVASGFDVNRQGFNVQAMRHLGAKAGVVRDGQNWIIMHTTPIQITITLAFIGNSYDQFIRFTSNWLHMQRSLSFELNIDETGMSVPIQVVGSEQLVSPELAAEGDSGELFIYETTLTMQTYSGYVQKIPGFIKLNTNIITVSQATALEIGQEAAQADAATTMSYSVRLKNPNPEL